MSRVRQYDFFCERDVELGQEPAHHEHVVDAVGHGLVPGAQLVVIVADDNGDGESVLRQGDFLWA